MTSQSFDATIGGVVYNVTVSSGGGGVANPTGWYNVTAYGAVGDGATDDTTAIQSAINAAELTGGVVVIPKGNYLVSSTIRCDYADANQHLAIDAYGARIFAASGLAGPVLEIGTDDASTLNVIVNGGHWGISSRDWTSTIGISLKSANRCVLRDVMVENCEVGIQVAGRDGAGSAYNTIAARRIVDCETGIYLTGDTDGWANSNKFYDTAIQYSTAVDAVDCSGGWAINIETPTNGEHIFNDNHFYGLTMEIASTHSAGKPGAVRVFGEQNNFYGLRIERFTEPFYVGISGTINAGAYYARRNKIIPGYMNNHYYANAIKDDTTSERLAFDFWGSQEKVMYGGSASAPILGLRASSSGYKAIEVYDNAGTTASFGVDSDGTTATGALTATGDITASGGGHVSAGGNVYSQGKLLFGTQDIQILEYNGSPNGAATAPKGSLAVDYANAVLYINTDGSTTWAAV